jgi:hypothetical protein
MEEHSGDLDRGRGMAGDLSGVGYMGVGVVRLMRSERGKETTTMTPCECGRPALAMKKHRPGQRRRRKERKRETP